MQIEFSGVVQKISEDSGKEVDSAAIRDAFEQAFIGAVSPLHFRRHTSVEDADDDNLRMLTAEVEINGSAMSLQGQGNGPIDAFVDAVRKTLAVDFRVVDYHQHTTGVGADAQSASYVEIQIGKGETRYGAALHSNIVVASLMAVCSAFNRAHGDGLVSMADVKSASE